MVTKVLTFSYKKDRTCLGKTKPKNEVIHCPENTPSNKSNQGHELMNLNKYLAKKRRMKRFMKGSGAADGPFGCFPDAFIIKRFKSCSLTVDFISPDFMIESSIERGTAFWSTDGWRLTISYLPEAKRIVLHHSVDGDYDEESLFWRGLKHMHVF